MDLHTGFFAHVAHVPNEVNALGHDVESLPKNERRTKLRDSEDKKWDEEYYMQVKSLLRDRAIRLTKLSPSRADYVDDEYIQELLHWRHPHAAPVEDFHYTEAENATMLRLPRKECEWMTEQKSELTSD